MLKAGVVGNGGIAGSHNRAYGRIRQEAGPVVVEAYCDIRPERLTDLGEARTYGDIDEMLAREQGRLDYVDICLPTYLHAEVAVKAMQAGFHVLCEKPMALNHGLAQGMCRTAKETGRTLMVGHVNRFMDDRRLIRDVVRSGELGTVRSAEFYREGGSQEPMGYNNWFRDGTLSGGAMLDLHIHDVDLIVWMFGMPQAVSATGAVVIPGSGYDAMSVNCLYDDNVFVHAGCDWTIRHDRFNTRAMRVNFTRGYVFCDRSPDRQAFVKVAEDGTVTDLAEHLGSDFFYNEISYYAGCLAEGREVVECPPEQSAEAVRLVMAEMASADQHGTRIEL